MLHFHYFFIIIVWLSKAFLVILIWVITMFHLIIIEYDSIPSPLVDGLVGTAE